MKKYYKCVFELKNKIPDKRYLFNKVYHKGTFRGFFDSKKECIEWIAEFYYEHYDKRSKSASETEKKALNWVNKCMRSAS